ncbi:hypothetical protein RF55_22538, partial [Lasius niger]
ILDISKTLMYDFHYNHIKNKYGTNARLLFTDTDSLCYEIATKDIYKDIAQDQQLYDTSDYPTDHPLHNNTNKKILGKFKDELSGEIVEEFVGLKPKMYSLKTARMEKKTAKGVAKELKHGQRIASSSHKIQTLRYGKVALCPIDTKRYLLENGNTSLAYGHYMLKV